MVYFNDPLPVENHPELAVRLALKMREESAELCKKWSKRGFKLGAGIGIDTGYATCGLIGFENRRDYAAMGPVTNLASRLCGQAQDGQILISKGVFHLVESFVSAKKLKEPLHLKGIPHPVETYSISGLKA